MLVVGLTGGIGSGKSTLGALLAVRGAHLIDADELGRLALEPGQPAWHAVVGQFGKEILIPGTMVLDRRRLADMVFADTHKLAVLNEIVHPVILARIADVLESLEGTDSIVVIDAALLYEIGLAEAVGRLIVVVAESDIRIERLMRDRDMTQEEVQARIDAQADSSEAAAKADFVVRNDWTIEKLEAEAQRLWEHLRALPQP
ncbi:MAG: dephospho-CoA kinase [Actinobacteria bacterium]|nr:dephospho-CoA kinase [Actinomycetota bacterium]